METDTKVNEIRLDLSGEDLKLNIKITNLETLIGRMVNKLDILSTTHH